MPGRLRCSNNDVGFKVIPQCEGYSEQHGLLAKVFVGQAGSNIWHPVKLFVDTGSPNTWIANYNTKVHKMVCDV